MTARASPPPCSPRGGKPSADFPIIIVGPENADPYPDHGDAIEALARQYLGMQPLSPKREAGLDNLVEISRSVARPEIHAAPPVTALDYTNGASFDIAQPYIELYLKPLCRYAALSCPSFDHKNGPLVDSIRARYAEVISFLDLGDIQSPTAGKP